MTLKPPKGDWALDLDQRLAVVTPATRVLLVHAPNNPTGWTPNRGGFLMTGWRLGWPMVAPAALDAANGSVPEMVGRLRAGRDRLRAGLQSLPGIDTAVPAGGMYAFFRIEGETDSLALAKRLVAEHGLGLAPGAAFGAEAEGWLRWCFASRDPARLDAGLQRLAASLRR